MGSGTSYVPAFMVPLPPPSLTVAVVVDVTKLGVALIWNWTIREASGHPFRLKHPSQFVDRVYHLHPSSSLWGISSLHCQNGRMLPSH